MTAKEMFEELGFSLYTHNDRFISFQRYSIIQFDLEYKEIVFSSMISIELSIFKAIQKQVEELGWLNE